VSVINGDTLNVSTVNIGHTPNRIAVNQEEGIAYVSSSESGTVSVIDGTDGNYSNIANITVGDFPINIAVDEEDNTAYVANEESNTISIIDETKGNYSNVANMTVGEDPGVIAVSKYDDKAFVTVSDTVFVINGTKGNYSNIANITVGKSPTSIAVDEHGVAYVTNLDSDSVSIIDRIKGKYSNIANITVGSGPSNLAVIDWGDEGDSIAYVANPGSNTVSIINGTDGNYSNIANIIVGEGLYGIDADQTNSIAYVATGEGISVLYGISRQVQAGVSFDVNPFHAGRIECKDLPVPTNQYFYIDFRTQCTAQANEGFQFSSWIENLGSNSSRTISASHGDWFTNTLDWVSGKPSPATLNVTKFGNFTANFETLPPAIPPEYLATLFTVVVTAFVGSWLTPSFIGWRKTAKQGKRLDDYKERVKQVYKDTDLSEKDKEKELSKIKEEIEYAYAKGKLTEQQYNLLNKKIESFVNTDDNKKSNLQDADIT
jgi:YVTN family beta-propeller protein